MAKRNLQPEWMDDPVLPAAEHHLALSDLTRLNAWAVTTRLLWRPIARLASHCPGRRLRVLDVASGAGDVAARLWQRGRRSGVDLEIVGLDISSRAVEHARQRAASMRASLRFETMDVLKGELLEGFDVVTSSLFLHHLADADAISLLERMAGAARRLVLVQDLRRSAAGSLLAWAAARLLTRSKVVHNDAGQSARAAFTSTEVRRLAQAARLDRARVTTYWPFRLLLEWSRT